MTAKEYLSQVHRFKAFMEEAEDDMKEVQLSIQSPKTIQYERIGSNGTVSDRTSDSMIWLEKAEIKYCEAVLGYHQLFMLVFRQISSISPGPQSELLILRYLCGQDLKSVAKSMDISYDCARHLHSDALKTFEQTFPELLCADTISDTIPERNE